MSSEDTRIGVEAFCIQVIDKSDEAFMDKAEAINCLLLRDDITGPTAITNKITRIRRLATLLYDLFPTKNITNQLAQLTSILFSLIPSPSSSPN